MPYNPTVDLQADLGRYTLASVTERGAEEPDFRNILEVICCENTNRVECREHFLNNTLIFVIHDNLKSGNKDKLYSTLCFIAVLAKYDNARNYITNIFLVILLLDKMRNSDYEIRVQACRALANLCYENVKTQTLIIAQDALEPIFFLLETSTMSNMKENNPKFKQVIVGLVLNLISENESILMEVAQKEVPTLVRSLEEDLSHQELTVSQNVFSALVALTEVRPVEIIFTHRVCAMAVDMYRRIPPKDYALPGLEFLEDPELPDVTKNFLAQSGLFDLFLEVLKNKPLYLTGDHRKKYELMGKILCNILSGDAAMEHVFKSTKGELLKCFDSWLSSEDKDLVQIAALCIGNTARSDTNSVTVVGLGIHQRLINVIRNNVDNLKLVYAAVSALRNLCIPKENKAKIRDDGIVDTLLLLMHLDVETSSPVVFKAVGALRQIIDGQKDITIRLGRDEDFVQKIVRWCSSALLPWVSSECCRFLCSLVNTSKDREVIINIVDKKGYSHIMRMLIALHPAMHSEALNCLTETSFHAKREKDLVDNLPEDDRRKSLRLLNYDMLLMEHNLPDKIKHLTVQHGTKMETQVLEDLFTFLEEILTFERVRCNLYYDGYKPIFRHMMRTRADYDTYADRVYGIENLLRKE